MKNTSLEQDELELLQAFELDEFESDLTPARKAFIEHAAAQTLEFLRVIWQQFKDAR